MGSVIVLLDGQGVTVDMDFVIAVWKRLMVDLGRARRGHCPGQNGQRLPCPPSVHHTDAQGGLGLECERIFSDMPHTHTHTYTSVASLFQISGVNLGSEATLTLHPQ